MLYDDFTDSLNGRASKMKRFAWLAVIMSAWTAPVVAVPTIDGKANVDEGYASLSVQNTDTRFGDSTTGDVIQNYGGNEIDQIFGVVSGGRLYVTVAGNLKMGFDKFEVFVDSIAGGVNAINTSLPVVEEFCCSGPQGSVGALQRMDGLAFDSGFNADYYLIFTHGAEHMTSPTTGERNFWAFSAHYADLTTNDGDPMESVPVGMQLAYRGMPNVLRFPGDYNHNGKVDGADYVVWRKTKGQSVARGAGADANGNQIIDDADNFVWRNQFGDGTALGDYPWVPNDLNYAAADATLGPQLPSLGQGKLIDRSYAMGAGGCTDDIGTGCKAAELEFALNSQRYFNNSIGLEMALDNSNSAGVTSFDPFSLTTGNPSTVRTGVEFSIPLSSIGNPAGPIKLTIFVNDIGHSFVSNQFSGEGVLWENLGTPVFTDMTEWPGNQYVTVANAGTGSSNAYSAVPEPGALVPLMTAYLFGLCGAVRCRR